MKKKVSKTKGNLKNLIWIVAILAVITLIVIVCMGYVKKVTYGVKNPVATMVVKDYGTITIELYPDQAENTVKNFITLANNGYYDGLTFHRIVKDFMIQGGDSKGDGSGSPTLSAIDTTIEKGSNADTEYNIDGEFMINDYEKNTLKLTKGVIAMARMDFSNYAYYSRAVVKEGYNTAGSQFFIMTSDDYASLTGQYAGFGKVLEGYDVLEKIADTKVTKTSEDENAEVSKPVKAPVIESIHVETFGETYTKPETHTPFDINSYFSSMFSTSAQ